jgi:hypothetical protein
MSDQAPAPPPTAPAPTLPSEAAPGLVFTAEVGVVLHPIKPDKAADFEAIVQRLRAGLLQSTDAARRQQGASLRVLKAVEPGPGGSILYLFLIDAPAAGADYTLSRMLAGTDPADVESLWAKLRDAYAGPMHRLTLNEVPAASLVPAPAAADVK